MKKVIKAPIIILILFSIAICTLFYFSLNIKTEFSNKNKGIKSVNFLVKNVELTINNNNGTQKAKLTTNKLQHDPRSNSTDLNNPILLVAESDHNWHITGQNGKITHEKDQVKKIEKIDLYNKVVITRININNNKNIKNNNSDLPYIDSITIETDKLSYLPKEDLIYTDQAVKIITKDSITTAVGLKYNKKTEDLKLISKVKTIYKQNS